MIFKLLNHTPSFTSSTEEGVFTVSKGSNTGVTGLDVSSYEEVTNYFDQYSGQLISKVGNEDYDMPNGSHGACRHKFEQLMKSKSRSTKMGSFVHIIQPMLSCDFGNIPFKHVLEWSNGSATVVNPVCRRLTTSQTPPLQRTGRSHLWVRFIEFMIEDYSLRKCAEELLGEVTHVTLFYWGHKILAALKQVPTEAFHGIVEMDETYFLFSEKVKRSIV